MKRTVLTTVESRSTVHNRQGNLICKYYTTNRLPCQERKEVFIMQMNVEKRIEDGFKLLNNSRYGLTCSVTRKLLALNQNDMWKHTMNCFALGYAQGVRATKAELNRNFDKCCNRKCGTVLL